MRARWLGRAGVAVEADGERVVVDPLEDTTAAFSVLGARAADVSPPGVLAPSPGALARRGTPLEPEQAAIAAELLGAGRLVPIHYRGYELPGIYEPVPNAFERARAASDRLVALDVGETLEV